MKYAGFIHAAMLILWLALPAKGDVAEEESIRWFAPNAPIRFRIHLHTEPSQTSAGYFLQIPVSGLFPDTPLAAQGYGLRGDSIQTYVLWHNPKGMLSIITEDAPREPYIEVYVGPTDQYRLWTRETGLTPSALLAVDSSEASMEAAHALSELGRVGSLVTIGVSNPSGDAPLGIGGDPTGRPRPASFYQLVYLTSNDPGRTWIAPFTRGGESRVRINDREITPQQRTTKWGGTGDWAEIQETPNRLEVFMSAPGEGLFPGQGRHVPFYLAWATPNASNRELGGTREDHHNDPGEAMWAARPVRRREVVRSGAGRIMRAEARDGAPVGLVQHDSPLMFRFEDEEPLLVYTFEAQGPRRTPEGISYYWTHPEAEAFRLRGRRIQWIFPALQEHTIQLHTESPAGITTHAYNFFGFSTRDTSLQDSETLEAYRSALEVMARALPANHPLVENWPDSVWNTLLRTIELYQDPGVLIALFTNHAEIMAEKYSEEEFHALQDLLIITLARDDPEKAIDWLQRFGRITEEQERRDALTLRLADLHIHYLGNLDQAADLLRSMHRSGLDDTQRALRIRLGDLALMRGNLNEATRYYAEVQNHARMERATARPGTLPGAARPLLGATADSELSEDWRMRALIDTAASESVRSLLDQGHLWEAREMLFEWERNLPLSKITSEFILLESRLYAAMQNPLRAQSMLLAFCKTVEGSSHLPEAAPLLLQLMLDAELPTEEIKSIGERLRDRLTFHPAAEKIAEILDTLEVEEEESSE